MVVANGHQHAAGARPERRRAYLGLVVQIEFFQIAPLLLLFAGIDAFGNHEEGIEHDGEGDAINGGDPLGKEIGDSDEKQNQRGGAKADWNFDAADFHVQRHLVLLVVALVAKNQHAERLSARNSIPRRTHRLRLTAARRRGWR